MRSSIPAGWEAQEDLGLPLSTGARNSGQDAGSIAYDSVASARLWVMGEKPRLSH